MSSGRDRASDGETSLGAAPTGSARPASSPVSPSKRGTVVVPWFHHHPVYRKILHWTRTLHTYLTMLALVMFLFFALTGFMLNHAEWFGLDETRTTTSELKLPATALHDKLALVEYLRAEGHVSGAVQPFDLPGSEDPFHVAFKSPRSQMDVDVTPADGKATIETQTRGVAGILTNLHTAKYAGRAWQCVLDATAILLFLASLTGFLLWYALPKRRKLGLIGLAASIVLVIVFYLMLVP